MIIYTLNLKTILILILAFNYLPIQAQEIVEKLEMIEDEKGRNMFSYVDNVLPNIEDVAIVGVGKKRGLANKKGELIIPMEYQSIEITEMGEHLLVQKKGKFGMMDMKGNILIPIEYNSMEFTTYGTDFSSVLIAVSKGKKYGIIKPDGSIFCPIIYEYIDFGGDEDIVAYVGEKKSIRLVVLIDGTIRERKEGE